MKRKEFKTPKEILSAACDLIREGRWIKKDYWRSVKNAEDQRGLKGLTESDAKTTKFGYCFCTVGAIKNVADSYEGELKSISLLAKQLPKSYNNRGIPSHDEVINWNDERRRTRSQVVRLFEKAIRSAS